MLQQTQVATVLPYFARFMARFPDVGALAEASLDEVLHLWSGLGYYARARNLHRAARYIRDALGGCFPVQRAALEQLPGIGRSTAAAILALSRDERHAILDGNAKRVLARYFAIDGDPGSAATLARLWERAEYCTPLADVAAYTQAIMDLGATLCTRTRPRCAACPLAEGCAARRTGRVHELPGRRRARARPAREAYLLLAVSAAGHVLLERRPPQGIWGGLWCPPQFATGAEARGFIPQALALAATATPRSSLQSPASIARERDAVRRMQLEATPLAPLQHAFTHFDLTLHPLVIRCPPRAVRQRRVPQRRSPQSRGSQSCAPQPNGPQPPAHWLWYDPRQPTEVGLPAPITQLIESIQGAQLVGAQRRDA